MALFHTVNRMVFSARSKGMHSSFRSPVAPLLPAITPPWLPRGFYALPSHSVRSKVTLLRIVSFFHCIYIVRQPCL